jgi:hypothetical protein
LKVDWKERLEELIFEGLNWPREKRSIFIKNWLTPQTIEGKCGHGSRWETSLAVDRTTYAAFIKYFVELFLENPSARMVEGETVCLLWILLYLAQDQIKKPTVQSILDLTTEHIENRTIQIGDQEIEMSMGLSHILQAYIGDKPARRHQKLFPNLTVDKLEDLFRKASQELLPSESSPILPGAFLTFPHCIWGVRMPPSLRRKIQFVSQKVCYKAVSSRDIIRQLRRINES